MYGIKHLIGMHYVLDIPAPIINKVKNQTDVSHFAQIDINDDDENAKPIAPKDDFNDRININNNSNNIRFNNTETARFLNHFYCAILKQQCIDRSFELAKEEKVIYHVVKVVMMINIY